VEVRLLFEHGGFARLSLLPQREESLPDELSVSGEGDLPTLLALQDEWYQDVIPADLAGVLRRGLVMQGVSGEQVVRWNLSGREVYVLARHSSLNGFVSAPRLIIGEEQVILCTEERRQTVLDAISATGSPEPKLLGANMGVPQGWSALTGVVPRVPVAPTNDGDILDVLRPLAAVEIVLDGGIRLLRSSWLAGYPPRIRLCGMAREAGQVLIDRQEAAVAPDGSCTAPGWDQLGAHEVWCHSVSKSYSIEYGPDRWEAWDAYSWSFGDMEPATGSKSPAICGVLVRPQQTGGAQKQAVTVPVSNLLLIGAEPGQVQTATARGDLRGTSCIAFPWFDPVWALPTDPWRCNKSDARIIRIGSGQAAGVLPDGIRPMQWRLVGAWCNAILAASRKGLSLAVEDERSQQLWQGYRRRAREIWRARR
jgi:hypothetical protein